MPPRVYNNQQQGRGRGRGDRSFERGYNYDYDDRDSDVQPYVPPTNKALRIAHGTDPSLSRVGMVADRIEATPTQTRLIFGEKTTIVQGEPVRNERLPGLNDLSSEPVEVEQRNGAVQLEGHFAVFVSSALVFMGGEEGERIAVFRRPEIEAFGRGEAGAVGFMQDQFGVEAKSEAAEEYLIFAKRGNEEVIVTVDTGEVELRQEYRISQAKERALQALRSQLQGATKRGGRSNTNDIVAKIKELEKPRKIVFLKEKPLSDSVRSAMQTIETKIDGDTEKNQGFVSYDPDQHIVTLLKPIGLDLRAAGIDPKSVRIVDGVGNRELRMVDSPSRSLSPTLQELARNLGRPKLVQEKKGDYIVMPPTLEQQLWSDPRTVLAINP